MGDCPRDLGGLAVLRGSHRYGVLPLAVHPGAGNRQAIVPTEMLEQLRWVTTDFSIGDVLLFPSMTVHAALHNATEFNMRVSVDFRYQPEGAPLTEIILHPHFQRLDWDEIYAGWSSTEHQYYWRDLSYEVVPFETFPVRGLPFQGEVVLGEGLAFEDALREQVLAGDVVLSEEDWRNVLTIEARREAREGRQAERRAAEYPEGTGGSGEEPAPTQGS